MINTIAENQTLQHAWDFLPKEKLVTTAKVVVAAIILYKLYAFYQNYQSLLARVQKLEADQKKPNPLANRVQQLEEQLQQFKTEFEDAIAPMLSYGGSTQTSFAVDTSPILSRQVEQPSHLELFKQKFPGKHLTCSYTQDGKTIETNFADFLLNTFFRMGEKPECHCDEQTQTFTLTYTSPKAVAVNALPKPIWDKAWNLSKVFYYALGALLKANPSLEIAETIVVQFAEHEDGIEIIAQEKNIFLIPLISYTGHLEKIFIPKNSEEKIFVQSQHNLPIDKNGGHLSHQAVVEAVAPIFFSNQ